MKYFFMLIVSVMPLSLLAQTNQEKSSKIIAQRMHDSLSLSGKQYEDIFKINLIIEEQKKNIRSASVDIENQRRKIQKVENSRDSLYATILSTNQFTIYKNQKFSLINVIMQ